MKIRFKFINLILALFVALFATGTVFAWFANNSYNLDIMGASAGAYFAYGDGTQYKKDSQGREIGNDPTADEDDWVRTTGPFGINMPMHMFNLAWLQNTGRFEDRKYYFELDSNVNMYDSTLGRNVVLPPIGNTEHPFDGEFNGNGYILSNLVISTNKKVLYGNPATSDYEFSQAVGLFGMTGEDSVIKNFILAYPAVEVANPNDSGVDTSYSNLIDSDGSTVDYPVVGLAVGYVAGTVQSIGVLGGALAVRRGGYSTVNSIIGTLSDEALKNITGNGSGSGDGEAGNAGDNFGNTFDVSTLLSRLANIAYAKYGITADANVKNTDISSPDPNAWRLPSLDNSSSNWTLAKGEKLPFVIVGNADDSYDWNISYIGSEPYEQISTKSTGYFLGNQTKIQTKTITFVDKAILDSVSYTELTATPNWLYTQANDWYSTGFAPVSQTTFDNLPQKIKDLVDFNAGEKGTFTTVRVQAQYTQVNPTAGRWTQLNEESWSYHGQITWNGQTYGIGLKSDPYNTDGFSYPVDEYGHYYTYDGYLTELINGTYYKLNDDLSYVINIDGWSTPVYELGTEWPYVGHARLTKGGVTYEYYIDENLIDENNYLFYFDGDEKRYISALEGWALPIYGVDAEGYALDASGNKYKVNEFYTTDENGFYMRANGTYVIKTPGWDTPIYVVDEAGYALTDKGGMYYTTTVGVYQKDGTCKFYDENGNPLILVDGQYIRPYGFDENGFAITEKGYYYTSTADSYLMYENGTYYRVDADGNKQINDNGRIVTPYDFDENGYAINEEGYYYNTTSNSIFYEKRIGEQWGNVVTKYYQIMKSGVNGDIWTYVPKSGNLVYTQIDDNGYAMYNDSWRYTTTDDVYEDLNGYNLISYEDGSYSYIMDAHETWNFSGEAYFGDDGILYHNGSGTQSDYVKGVYFTDTNGYVITTTGAYALDENNEIIEDSKILYGVNEYGKLTYSSGAHAGEVVAMVYTWGGDYQLPAVSNGYDKIETATGEEGNLATAITGTADDRLQQAAGTLEDRVQATHEDEFTDNYVTVKTAETDERPQGVSGDVGPFHQMIEGIFLPNNGVWFKPTQAGMIRFVMYADEDGLNFDLLRIERQVHADGSVSFDDANISISKALQQQLPKYVLFYYEYEVTQADIDAGNVEFVIMRDNNSQLGGSYLLYLDLGASALDGDGESDENVNSTVSGLMANAIDFVYKNVTIAQSGENVGKFIIGTTLYVETDTMISFGTDNGGAIVAFYYRKDSQPDSDGKTINAAYNSGDNSLTSTNTNKATITTTQKDITVDGYLNPTESAWIPS